jgi:hypothetical protein
MVGERLPSSRIALALPLLRSRAVSICYIINLSSSSFSRESRHSELATSSQRSRQTASQPPVNCQLCLGLDRSNTQLKCRNKYKYKIRINNIENDCTKDPNKCAKSIFFTNTVYSILFIKLSNFGPKINA